MKKNLSNLALKEFTVSASTTYWGNSFHASTTLLLKKCFLTVVKIFEIRTMYLCDSSIYVRIDVNLVEQKQKKKCTHKFRFLIRAVQAFRRTAREPETIQNITTITSSDDELNYKFFYCKSCRGLRFRSENTRPAAPCGRSVDSLSARPPFAGVCKSEVRSITWDLSPSPSPTRRSVASPVRRVRY